MRSFVRRHSGGSIVRPSIILLGLLTGVAISVGTATLLRPRPQIITVTARALTPAAELDSLRRRVDSLDEAIGEAAARLSGRAPLPSAIRIGEPSLVAFLPDSIGLDPDLAKLGHQFRAALPHAARVAADHRFRFYVRPSAGLQLWGPDQAPIRGAVVTPQDLGYLIAAPRYPAIRLRGTYSDSALADALARYAALIGTAGPSHQPS